MPPKRMKPVSRDEGFQSVRRLKCFNEVFERLKAGWAPSELARFIQDDRGEYGHATKTALMQVLQRFKDTIPPAQLFSTRIPEAFHEAKKEVEEGLDELKEMEKLYRLQMERIQIDRSNEKQSKKLIATMTQEIRVARELLTGIADLKMDLGLTTRAGENVNVNVSLSGPEQKYGKKSIADVMESPERRRKVLNLAERLMTLPDRVSIDPDTIIDVVENVPPADPGPSSSEDPSGLVADEDLLVAELEAIERDARDEGIR